MLIKLSIPRIPAASLHVGTPSQSAAGIYAQPDMGLPPHHWQNQACVYVDDFYISCERIPKISEIIEYFKKKIKESDDIKEICKLAFTLEILSSVSCGIYTSMLTKYGDKIEIPINISQETFIYNQAQLAVKLEVLLHININEQVIDE